MRASTSARYGKGSMPRTSRVSDERLPIDPPRSPLSRRSTHQPQLMAAAASRPSTPSVASRKHACRACSRAAFFERDQLTLAAPLVQPNFETHGRRKRHITAAERTVSAQRGQCFNPRPFADSGWPTVFAKASVGRKTIMSPPMNINAHPTPRNHKPTPALVCTGS
jgi:hypothetical protein